MHKCLAHRLVWSDLLSQGSVGQGCDLLLGFLQFLYLPFWSASKLLYFLSFSSGIVKGSPDLKKVLDLTK